MQKHPAAAFALATVLIFSGCATQAPLACPDQGPAPRAAKVYFATDRKPAPDSAVSFGSDRSEPPRLRLGWQRVTLGAGHRIGKVDAAVAPTGAFMLSDPIEGPAEETLQRGDVEIEIFVEQTVRRAIRSAPAPRPGERRQVLLFVHGYNTSFDYAVRKAAQLAADLELVTCSGEARGVPIAYSWPSKTSLFGYLADEENVEWTQQRFAPFLEALARVSRQEGADLHVMAHSMGSRLLVRTLADLANSCKDEVRRGPLFNQVILLAPDIGKGLFDQYLERVLPLIGHLTIYVSENDRALALSRILHGGHRRLGLVESSLLAALELTGLPELTRRTGDAHRRLGSFRADATGTRIDMIDVSAGISGPFGHSYEDPEFIADLKELIYNQTPAGTGARSNLVPGNVGPQLFGVVEQGVPEFFRLEAN